MNGEISIYSYFGPSLIKDEEEIDAPFNSKSRWPSLWKIARTATLGLLFLGSTYLCQRMSSSLKMDPLQPCSPNLLDHRVQSIARDLVCLENENCLIQPEEFHVEVNSFPCNFFASPASLSLRIEGGVKMTINIDIALALQGMSVRYTSEEAEGIVAHEVGHAALKHLGDKNKSVKQKEFEADLFALRRPKYALGLKKALCSEGKLFGGIEIFRDARLGEDVHPSLFERVVSLNRVLYIDPEDDC